MKTEFLPPQKADNATLQRQCSLFAQFNAENISALEHIPDAIMLLNDKRQIVFTNNALLEELKVDLDTIIKSGMRPGNVFSCRHADADAGEGGCGTSEFCRVCGAAILIQQVQQGNKSQNECRIRCTNGDALDLRVWGVPLEREGEQFTLLAIQDISDEKRRRYLERIFLHDLANTASAISGFAGLMQDCRDDANEHYGEIVYQLSNRLLDEIDDHRQLAAAENHELKVHLSTISTTDLIIHLVRGFESLPVANGREIKISSDLCEIEFICDRTLLRRVLANMLKNGLEACQGGERVTIGCRERDESVEFFVHNPGKMPRDVQLQVFQRSFSTKGESRGLGTYSMHLLSTRYLQGDVTFESSAASGTTFVARYPRTPQQSVK